MVLPGVKTRREVAASLEDSLLAMT